MYSILQYRIHSHGLSTTFDIIRCVKASSTSRQTVVLTAEQSATPFDSICPEHEVITLRGSEKWPNLLMYLHWDFNAKTTIYFLTPFSLFLSLKFTSRDFVSPMNFWTWTYSQQLVLSLRNAGRERGHFYLCDTKEEKCEWTLLWWNVRYKRS